MRKSDFLTRITVALILSVPAQIPAAARNLALNPNDYHDSTGTNPKNTFPHATSNSETRWRTENSFWAARAIDGVKNNTNAEPSWGPEQPWTIPNPWLKITLDKTYEVDSVIILIRALFAASVGGSNHDTYFKTGVLNFSDGSKQAITIDSTSKPQTFKLNKIKTSYVLLNTLLEAQPLQADGKWAAITEFEIWGQDTATVEVEQPSSSRKIRGPHDAATMVMPATAYFSMPIGYKGLEVFTLLGRRLWSFTPASTGRISNMKLPAGFGDQVVRIKFTK
jgi:hypothetical protein